MEHGRFVTARNDGSRLVTWRGTTYRTRGILITKGRHDAEMEVFCKKLVSWILVARRFSIYRDVARLIMIEAFGALQVGYFETYRRGFPDDDFA
jgi:hypothetical protein